MWMAGAGVKGGFKYGATDEYGYYAVEDKMHIPTNGPSLGGVETLVTRPASTSHRGLSPVERDRLGLTDGLIRVSVGIEAIEDLIADFDQALR